MTAGHRQVADPQISLTFNCSARRRENAVAVAISPCDCQQAEKMQKKMLISLRG